MVTAVSIPESATAAVWTTEGDQRAIQCGKAGANGVQDLMVWVGAILCPPKGDLISKNSRERIATSCPE